MEYLGIVTKVEQIPGGISTISTREPYKPHCDGCRTILVPWPTFKMAEVFIDGDLEKISQASPNLLDTVAMLIQDYLTIFKYDGWWIEYS